MSDLDDAAQRLEQAVQRLEAASKRLSGKAAAKGSASPALAETTAMVAARLEEAILRIDRLLEE